MIHNILHISDIHFTLEDDSYLRDNREMFIDELANEIESVSILKDTQQDTGSQQQKSDDEEMSED